MGELVLEWNPTEERLESLRLLFAELRREVAELRDENVQLHRQVFELRREVGFRKNLHARAIERNDKLKAELNEVQAEVRQLKDERFGKKSEKQSSSDRTNDLVDPQADQSPKKSGTMKGHDACSMAPIRRDDRAVCCLTFACHDVHLVATDAPLHDEVRQGACRG